MIDDKIFNTHSKKLLSENIDEDDFDGDCEEDSIEDQFRAGYKIKFCKDLLVSEVEPEYFIVNPLVPEQAITSITADSGKGKSLFALILAYHIASNKMLFDKYDVKQSKVLIIDQEMNENEVVTRFKKIVHEEIGIDYITDQAFTITNSDNFVKLLSDILKYQYKVIIFDTFTEIHDREENDSGAMKEVNARLLKLIRLTGVTLIYLHHHRKLQKGEKLSQSSSRGSSEIIAKVSSHLLLDSKNYKDEFGSQVLEITLSQEKARSSVRLNGKISFKVYNDQESGEMKWEYLGEVADKAKKIQEAKVFIMETLEQEPGATVKSLEDKSDIGSNNIRNALKELVAENKVDVGQLGKAKYYSIVH